MADPVWNKIVPQSNEFGSNFPAENQKNLEYLEEALALEHTFPGVIGPPQTAGKHNYAAIAAGIGLPAGIILDWPTETAPAGWLECDGTAVSRTTYANLFAAIGVMFGNGDGATTFNLPDLRGKFRRGWAHGSTADPDRAARTNRGDGTTGDHVGTKQADDFKSHLHTYYRLNQTPGLGNPGTQGYAINDQSTDTGTTGGSETRPINVYFMTIIKT